MSTAKIMLRSLTSAYRALMIYLITNLLISGLSSFIVPFFFNSSLEAAEIKQMARLCTNGAIWIVVAVAVVLLDYHGNLHNVKIYNDISATHYKKYLTKAVESKLRVRQAQDFSPVQMTSVLLRDADILASIDIWSVSFVSAALAMLIILLWSMRVPLACIAVILLECVCVTWMSGRYAKKVDAANQRFYADGDRLRAVEYTALNCIYKGFGQVRVEEMVMPCALNAMTSRFSVSLLRVRRGAVIEGLDLALNIALILALTWLGEFKPHIIMPVLTIYSACQEQLMGMNDALASIRSNKNVFDQLEAAPFAGEIHRGSATEPRRAENAIELEGICLKLDARALFQDFSIQIQRGNVVALIGKNGSGKTTLLKLIAGIYSPDAGEVRRLEIAYAPVSSCLFEDLSVGENLALVNSSVDAQTQRALAAQFNDADCWEDKAAALSVGQKQMMNLLRCCISRADILLLDEPTAPLAKHKAEKVMDMLRRSGKTVLFTTHDMRLAEKADRVIDLDQRRT